VFVASRANGWLFWNTDSNHTTIEEGASLNGGHHPRRIPRSPTLT